MADYVPAPSHIKIHFHRCVKGQLLVPKTIQIQSQRKCFLRSGKVIQVPVGNTGKLGAPCFSNLQVGPFHRRSSTRCYIGALINTDDLITSDWIPLVDQVLLMVSMLLAHVAGVVPSKRSRLDSPLSIPLDHVVSEDNSFYGSASENVDTVDLKFTWDVVETKLINSLNSIGNRSNLGDKAIEFEQVHSKQPSSLFAVAEGPRLRLLSSSFQWLKNEVGNITRNSTTLKPTEWLMVFSEIIQKSCQPVCTAWLEGELFLENRKLDKALISLMIDKFNGCDTVLQNIRKLGKENLYAELICILKSGSLREGCCYNLSLFTQHGIAILEDLVITLADGVANMYLELISVDSELSSEMNSLGLGLCTLSTRALQKLRNEVALNQWLHQYTNTVTSMYEDRFELHALQSQVVGEACKSKTAKLSWWKKLSLRNSADVLLPSRYAVITSISIPVKRTRELRALTGWRYYFSLFLELADITMPVMRRAFAILSDAVSFFLVCLIGRSLGLIYTGIRQALRWK